MKNQWMLATLVAVAIAGSWVLLHGNNSHAQTPAANAALPEVTVAQALTRQVSDSAEFTGRLQAVDTVQVQPRVGGFVDSVHFQEGALVHKDDVLFQLDPRPYQAEVDRLTANQAQAQAALNLAITNQRRAVMLLAQHAVAQQDADNQDTAEQGARAQVAASTAALAAARLDLEFTQVRSPIDGRVSNIRITAGNLVTSSDVLTSVVSVNPVYVYFDVDEQTWLKLDHLRASASQAGHEARIEATMGLADESGYPHDGRLDFVDNQLHTESGTMRLRAVFDNRDGLYTPGLYARVQLQSGQARPRLLVDDRAIGTDLGNQFVYVVDKDHKVEYRKVSTGALFDGLRIVDSGLDASDVVIVNGLQHVRPGAEVNPQKVAMQYRLDDNDKALVDANPATPPALIHDDEHIALPRSRRHRRQEQAFAGLTPTPMKNIAQFFVNRPIMAAVLSLLFVITGSIAVIQLPNSEYPEVVPPTVVVHASYPGANPKVIAETVATPLEEQINGVEGMLYTSSQATSDGALTLTVTFALGTDLQTAQVDVQNRVAQALPKLPEEVQRLGVTTQKSSPDLTMVVHLTSPDQRYDMLYLSNYARLHVKDVLGRLDGVGDVQIFGAGEYSMRVWLDPQKLARARAHHRRCDRRDPRAERTGRRRCAECATRSDQLGVPAQHKYAWPTGQRRGFPQHHRAH